MIRENYMKITLDIDDIFDEINRDIENAKQFFII